MFITIDGPDGVGKTTVAHALVDILNKEFSKKAIYTCEPTHSELGQEIRNILKSATFGDSAILTELFVKDRKQHLNAVSYWLNNDKIVVCDRYIYSTIVYQQLQGEDIGKLISMNSSFMKPDYAFILNVDNVDVLLNHITTRDLEKDMFETSLILKEAIRLYQVMDNYYENVIFIDGMRQPKEIVQDMLKHIDFKETVDRNIIRADT